jgi:hypothetical protein
MGDLKYLKEKEYFMKKSIFIIMLIIIVFNKNIHSKNNEKIIIFNLRENKISFPKNCFYDLKFKNAILQFLKIYIDTKDIFFVELEKIDLTFDLTLFNEILMDGYFLELVKKIEGISESYLPIYKFPGAIGKVGQRPELKKIPKYGLKYNNLKENMINKYKISNYKFSKKYIEIKIYCLKEKILNYKLKFKILNGKKLELVEKKLIQKKNYNTKLYENKIFKNYLWK